MNRRTLLKSFVAGAASAAVAPALVVIETPVDAPQTRPASGNVSSNIAQLIARRSLEMLGGNMTLGRLVNRTYDRELAQLGDTVIVPIEPQLVSDCWGGDPPPRNLRHAAIPLNYHVESTFNLPDIGRVLSRPEILDAYALPAVVAIADKIDEAIMSLRPKMNGLLCSALWNDVEDVLDEVETVLFKQRIPQSFERFVVVDSANFSNICQHWRFMDLDHSVCGYGSRGWFHHSMVVGRFKNLTVLRSHHAKRGGIAFAQDAIGMVGRRIPINVARIPWAVGYAEMSDMGLRVSVEPIGNPKPWYHRVTIETLFGVGVLRQNFGLQITC